MTDSQISLAGVDLDAIKKRLFERTSASGPCIPTVDEQWLVGDLLTMIREIEECENMPPLSEVSNVRAHRHSVS